MSILLVEDDESIAIVITAALEAEGFDVVRCDSIAARNRLLQGQRFAALVSDVILPDGDGIATLDTVRAFDADLPVVIVSAQNTLDTAVRASGTGAFEYFPKPFDIDELARTVRQAVGQRSASENQTELDEATQALPLVGRSPPMQAVFRMITRVLRNDLTVLILGESGTGKELVAEAIHQLGHRAAGPFVAVNTAAIPAELIESELFGHEAGAFPGALRPRYGKFEHARGGTILLDEIGSMPLDLQTKLLRVIQERTITRLGSNEAVPLDVRFIALSKVDLQREVVEGRFRDDLFYRLNVVKLHVPPLSERREDIPLLFMQLAREAAARYRREEIDLPQGLLREIAMREWPGNVRELRNAADRQVLGLNDLHNSPDDTHATLSERVAAFEKAAISASLLLHGGKLKAVYGELGISRKTLYEKMVRYRLSKASDDD